MYVNVNAVNICWSWQIMKIKFEPQVISPSAFIFDSRYSSFDRIIVTVEHEIVAYAKSLIPDEPPSGSKSHSQSSYLNFSKCIAFKESFSIY